MIELSRKRVGGPDASPGTDPGMNVGLGGHLRQARQARGLTLRELADRAGCSESIVSKMENGRVNPSIKLLTRVCGAVGITVGDLFSWAESGDEVVMRAADHVKMRLPEHGSAITMERLGPPRLRLGAFLNTMEPGFWSGVLSHEGEELGYLLEGTLELVLGDRVFVISEGDSFSFQSDAPHSYRNASSARARVIIVNSPPSI